MTTLGRITRLECRCGYVGDVYVSAADGWAGECPACNARLTADGSRPKGQRFYGDRRFAGSETLSMMEGCHPSEVAQHRALFDAQGACRTTDNGDVHFESRSQQRKYVRLKNAMGLLD